MTLLIHSPFITNNSSLILSGSKSETNRLLLLQSLYPELQLENTSNSDDSLVMRKALTANASEIDIHHAGTAMRFLTAFFAIQPGREIVLTGSPRMKERPIKILVDALCQMGAEITYEARKGFPPIRIIGKSLAGNKITLPANVSSQYISALLLIAPKLANGLELTLEGTITSVPYIKMTLALLNELGIESTFNANKISVKPKRNITPKTIIVESDWSSASYFYSIIALSSPGTMLTLSNYKQHSLQGDSALIGIYKNFGVDTTFQENTITLGKNDDVVTDFNANLNETPDLAQTIAVTCFGLGVSCQLSGLHTLKIKETDRLTALKAELAKLGGKVETDNERFTLEPSPQIKADVQIETYQDHRMAMAFAPLALKVPMQIADADVVSKSYPAFWKDLKDIGFQISELL